MYFSSPSLDNISEVMLSHCTLFCLTDSYVYLKWQFVCFDEFFWDKELAGFTDWFLLAEFYRLIFFFPPVFCILFICEGYVCVLLIISEVPYWGSVEENPT